MTGTVAIGEEYALAAHPLRSDVLAEVHARPFTPIETPRRLLHFVFLTDAAQAEADRAALASYLQALDIETPAPQARSHRVPLGAMVLRWEQHTEFTTYTWDMPSEALAGVPVPFHPPAAELADPMRLMPQPGPLLAAVDLHLIADAGAGIAPERLFEHTSLARAVVHGGAGEIATDFQSDAFGYIRILVLDRALGPVRAGALVQHLIEIETYRPLALLGLPEARRVATEAGRIEQALADLAGSAHADGSTLARRLGVLTALASDAEAMATTTAVRLAASRAYGDILQQRLAAIAEQAAGEGQTWSSVLLRRTAPALHTCQAAAERQAALLGRLAFAADLLRTQVTLDQLAAANRRMRLQRTVDALAIAVGSYCIVGLIGYVAGGAAARGLVVDPGTITAAAVPATVLALWWFVRQNRKPPSDNDR